MCDGVQDGVTRAHTINGLLSNRSKSISEQRRALLLPQELMQFPTDRLLLLRGGIPPIIGDKIFYFKSRFFKKRLLPPPVVLPLEKHTNQTIAPPPSTEERGLDKRCAITFRSRWWRKF